MNSVDGWGGIGLGAIVGTDCRVRDELNFCDGCFKFQNDIFVGGVQNSTEGFAFCGFGDRAGDQKVLLVSFVESLKKKRVPS